ncbi:Thymidine kinase [Streptomyces californicus]
MVAAAHDDVIITASVNEPHESAMTGVHGSLTPVEKLVPLLEDARNPPVPRPTPPKGARPLMPELVFFSGTMDCGNSTLALQIGHNRSARGLQGVIFTRDDRAGEGKLSSRLGLVMDAVEAEESMDVYVHIVGRVSRAGRVDYVIVDEAQFLAPTQIDQLARVVDELGLDVFAFGITTDFRTKLFPGSQPAQLASRPPDRSPPGRALAGAARAPRTTPVRWTARWSSKARRSSSATSTGRRARSVTRCCAAATTAAA